MTLTDAVRGPPWSLKQLLTGFMSAPWALAAALSSPTSPSSASNADPGFSTSEAGNPFIDGWYADPDVEYYDGRHWVYVTSSLPYEQQIYMDAFSSPDLVSWTKHPNVLTTANVSWAYKALWAPAPIARNGKYYLYFGANDILIDEIANGLVGGIGVAVADSPEGPYVDAIGEPLIGDFHNGAQPIDQDVFIDPADGQAYIYYGGHSHANVAKLNDDMISLGTFDDGVVFREITPENYVEGSQMVFRNGVYYFMWSEGGWTGPDYSVSYAKSASPLGPFDRKARILQQDAAVARGSGHNGVINVPGTDVWYMVYHRRPLSETDGNHRVTCYDRMYFVDVEGEKGSDIAPVQMLVKDNFADRGMIAWTTFGNGSWAVEDQKLTASVTDPGERTFALLDTNFTDVVFDALVGSPQALPSLILRASKSPASSEAPALQDYYFAQLQPESVRIGIVSDGVQTILAESNVVYSDELEHMVRVTAVGDLITVSLDDDEIVQATDGTLQGGANGVAVDGEGATFDDVSVARP